MTPTSDDLTRLFITLTPDGQVKLLRRVFYLAESREERIAALERTLAELIVYFANPGARGRWAPAADVRLDPFHSAAFRHAWEALCGLGGEAAATDARARLERDAERRPPMYEQLEQALTAAAERGKKTF